MAALQIRIDDELKKKSDDLFKALGTDTNSAVKIFLAQAVAKNGFPFEIKRVEQNPYAGMSEDLLFEKLERARESAAKGNYQSADSVVDEMRAFYDL